MDTKKIGQFICEVRKEKQMTQKELAARIHITDKAVSKWERGLSCPDIAILGSVAEALGVTTSELLNGERKNEASQSADVEASVGNALAYAEKSVTHKMRSWMKISSIIYIALLAIAVITCGICDLAISGGFTWSWYVTSSCIYTLLLFLPAVLFRKGVIIISLAMLSVLTVPYLYVINILVGSETLFMKIAVRMSIVGIAYLWLVLLIFWILKKRKWLAGACSMALAIPVCILINYLLSGLIGEPLVDIWDVLSMGIILIIAVCMVFMDRRRIPTQKQE